MSNFKEFYNNYGKTPKPVEMTPESMFFEAVGVKIPSLNAFTAWLILTNKIKPYIEDVKNDRPHSLFNVKPHDRILHFVNSVPSIKKLAGEFSEKWN